jgi:hypothetical protein
VVIRKRVPPSVQHRHPVVEHLLAIPCTQSKQT